jgi:ribosomal protein S12 methylthiotransferase accessory factor
LARDRASHVHGDTWSGSRREDRRAPVVVPHSPDRKVTGVNSPRPRFRDEYSVAVLPGDGVFLQSESARKRLRGPLFEAVAPLLDGSRTADEIVERLAREFQPPDVYLALLTLKSEGLLLDGPVGDARAAAYWQSLGSSPDEAGLRLATRAVGVTDLGTETADRARACFERHGLKNATDAWVRVVLVNDYLASGLGETADRLRADACRWLPVQPRGLAPIFGPLFGPGSGPCYRCLEQRLRGNRPVDEMIRLRSGDANQPTAFRGATDSSMEAAFAVLAARLVAWLGSDDDSHLAGIITSFNPATTAFATHRLDRRPQCPSCGDPDVYRKQLRSPVRLTPQPRPAENDGGSRVVPAEQAVARLERLLGPITGVVRDLERIDPFPGSPVRLYSASHAGPALPHPRAAFHGVAGEGGAGGKGLSDMQARASALGEAIERASGVFQGDEVVVRAAFEALGNDAIHPNDCMLFSERQYAAREEGPVHFAGMHAVPVRFDPRVVLDWTPVWSLTRECHRYVPTQYLYFAHPGPVEQAFSHADSNGNACGNTLEEAILQGLLELIERDAVAIWWYNRLRMPAVDLRDGADRPIVELLDFYRGIGRQVHALDLTHDLGVPVFAAISRVAAGGPQEILVGFGAHLDPFTALGRALTEMNQMLAIAERYRAGRLRMHTQLSHWLASGTIEEHDYLAPSPDARATSLPRSRERVGIIDGIESCRRALESAGLEVLVLDQTRPDLNIPVAKVIVPGLRHFWIRLGPGRLYDVPVATGMLDRAKAESEMNPLPMFL